MQILASVKDDVSRSALSDEDHQHELTASFRRNPMGWGFAGAISLGVVVLLLLGPLSGLRAAKWNTEIVDTMTISQDTDISQEWWVVSDALHDQSDAEQRAACTELATDPHAMKAAFLTGSFSDSYSAEKYWRAFTISTVAACGPEYFPRAWWQPLQAW